MSKRTEEIKLRVTPQEKLEWQEIAAEEQTSVSEVIRRLMNGRVKQNVPSDPTEVKDFVFHTPFATRVENGSLVIPIPVESQLDEDDLAVIKGDATPQPDSVGTSGEVGAFEEPERRTEPCLCGKPSWLFCRVCDA